MKQPMVYLHVCNEQLVIFFLATIGLKISDATCVKKNFKIEKIIQTKLNKEKDYNYNL